METNQQVREFWEQQPCGTSQQAVGEAPPGTREWFERVEEARYRLEPFIPSAAQFTRHHGKELLEIGVGAGTDHLQWARAGAHCHGIDLTEAAIKITRARLQMYGFTSDLRRADAETLPFAGENFDLVYSWGVIHHSEHPERIVAEIHRVLKPGGQFIGMMYGRHSLKVLIAWVWFALLRGKPWLRFTDVLRDHVESPGTKAYTVGELREMFRAFSEFSATPVLTPYDKRVSPEWLSQFFPERWGWFVVLRARK